MKKTYLILTLLILSSIIYFSLSLTPKKEETVNIYSARKEKFISEIIEIFYQDTGIKVNLLVDKAPKLIAKLESEKHNTPADLFLTSDIINIEKAVEKNLLRKIVDPNILKSVPKQYRDTGGYWVGVSQRARLIFYNNKLIDGQKSIKDYSDLAKPEHQNTILVRSSSNPYNQALISELIHYKGAEEAKEILKKIVNNFARQPEGGDTDQLKALAKGIGKIAIANDYYYKRIKASKDPIMKNYAAKISVIYPNQNSHGYHINLSSIAITKHSKNHDNAIKFISFLLSKKMQQYFVSNNFETSVNIPETGHTHKANSTALNYLYKNAGQAIKIADQVGWQ